MRIVTIHTLEIFSNGNNHCWHWY